MVSPSACLRDAVEFYGSDITIGRAKKGNLVELKSIPDSPYMLPIFNVKSFRQLTDRYFENRPIWCSTEYDDYAWHCLREVERYIFLHYHSDVDICVSYSDAILKCKDTFLTSPGYPYCETDRTKFNGPDSFNADLDYWILESEKLAKALLEGKRPVVFNLFLKDELVKKVKVESGQQRGICGASFNLVTNQTYCVDHLYESTKRARLDPKVPYVLGLDVYGRDYHERVALHNTVRHHWCGDVSGLEFVVPDGMYKDLYEIYLPFIPDDRVELFRAIADQLSQYVVRGSRVGLCIGGTPSGHKGTSQDNSRITYFLMCILLREQGISLPNVILSIQGDDIWLSTDLPFDPVRAKEYARSIGVTLKGTDRMVDLYSVEFLSRTPLVVRDTFVSICSSDRASKLKHTAFVYSKKRNFTVVNEKFQSLLFSECFNDDLWNYLIQAYAEYPLQERVQFNRRSYCWQRLGFQGHVKFTPFKQNQSQCITMTKTASQKARMKSNKKKLLVSKKSVQMKKVPLLAPNPLTGSNEPKYIQKYNKARSVTDKTVAQAKLYVMGLKEPRVAFETGFLPAPPDMMNKGLYRFATVSQGDLPTVLNGSNNQVYLQINPFGNTHIAVAATYAAGIPATYNITNAQNYSSWATSFNQIRCVAIELELFNTSPVSLETGTIVLMNSPRDESAYIRSIMASSAQANVQPFNDLKVKRITWAPIRDDTTGDFELKPVASPPSTYDNATCMVAWADFGNFEQTLHYRVTAFWEAEVFQDLNNQMRPLVQSPSPEVVNSLLYKLNTADPVYGDAHVEARDLAYETKAMSSIRPRGGKGKLRRILDIVGETNLADLVSAAAGYFGLGSGVSFSSLTSHDRLHRLTHLMNEEDVDVLCTALRGQPTLGVLKERLCASIPTKNRFVFVDEKKSS